MNELIQSIQQYTPTLLMAAGFLIGGWLVASLGAAIVKGILKKTKVDNRIAAWVGGPNSQTETIQIEGLLGSVVFYVILLFGLVGFFETLGVTIITEPLNLMLAKVTGFLPQLAMGVGLFVLSWLVATVVKSISFKAIQLLPFQQKLNELSGQSEASQSVSKSVSETLYWLVFLIFLPFILNTLSLTEAMAPINVLVTKIVGYLPNLLSAAILLAIGWFAATIIQKIVSNLVTATGLEGQLNKLGFTKVFGQLSVARVSGTICYALVFIPVAISALTELGIEAISGPAIRILEIVAETIPLLLGATIILAATFFIGRLLSRLVTKLLSGIGFDNVLTKLGIAQFISTQTTPSQIVGTLTLVAVVMFGLTEAFAILGLTNLNLYVDQLVLVGGNLLVGLVILAIGLLIANTVASVIENNGMTNGNVIGLVAKTSILFLTVAMALRQMGFATEIIQLAFGILAGAVAVAFAIAVGLGSRDVVAREIGEWVNQLKVKQQLNTPDPAHVS